MKTLGMINVVILSAFLAVALPATAQEQHEQEQKATPAKQEEKRAEPSKPKQQEAKPAERPRSGQNDAKPAEAAQPKQADDKRPTTPAPEAKEQRPAPAAQQHVDRSNHGRIPDDRFRANFGREHAFAINRPEMYQGAPRFQYGGYWFRFGQAWPSGWEYSDNVYVEYDEGEYYLYNPAHPGIRIIINIM